ncbi:MAG: hypothetical protein AAEJ52_13425, partial [Myxococcota bacterium]
WQLPRRGRGVFDVAFFLCQSLDTPMRRSVEMDLMQIYHRTLEADGVAGYSFEQCQYDYRLALLGRFGALISTIAALPLREDQLRMHIEVLLLRNVAAIVDHSAGDLLVSLDQ